MSRPRHYWYGIAKKMIMRYQLLENEHTLQARLFQKAVEDALEETRRLPNGDRRVKAVKDVLIYKSMTLDDAASEAAYERRTVQGWLNSFVGLVGKKAGY